MNFINPYGPSALIEATTKGLTDIVKFLLEAGADPNIFDNVSMFLSAVMEIRILGILA